MNAGSSLHRMVRAPSRSAPGFVLANSADTATKGRTGRFLPGTITLPRSIALRAQEKQQCSAGRAIEFGAKLLRLLPPTTHRSLNLHQSSRSGGRWLGLVHLSEFLKRLGQCEPENGGWRPSCA